MAFSVRVLADSKSPVGDRLTTILATYPRVIHSENMTHRIYSKNSASSRAIPGPKLLANIEADPFVPVWWGKNEPGMQAFAEVEDKAGAEAWWREGIAQDIAHARKGAELGLHKQIVNRVVETGMWITVVMSGTTWTNFEGLRCHKDAEPHFQRFAGMAMEALAKSTPQKLQAGAWHLPFIQDSDIDQVHAYVEPTATEADVAALLCKISVGRCARVSYLTHDGQRDIREDIKLHDKLIVQDPAHATPAEHVAQALDWPLWFRKTYSGLTSMSSKELNEMRFAHRETTERTGEITVAAMAIETALAQIQSGNFRGFKQYRKMQPREHIGERMP